MQQQKARQTKQQNRNKTEYELETAVVSETKAANITQNEPANKDKKDHINSKQIYSKQKQQNKTTKSSNEQKIQTPGNKLLNNQQDDSEGQKSSDSSLSSNQKTKKDINIKENQKDNMKNPQKSSSRSSSSKSSSSDESSPSHKPPSEKPSKLQQNKIRPALKKTVDARKDKENNDKDKTQKQTAPHKKSQSKIKKTKSSDQESDYAPNKRQAEKNRKSKQINKTKISQDQSEAKEDIKPAQKIKSKDTSAIKNIPTKPAISNKVTSPKTLKNEDKKAPQKPELEIEQNLAKQRNLRSKKPIDYKRLQADQINHAVGAKIPFRGRYKQTQKPALPPTVEASLKDIIKNIPAQSKQDPQKMVEQKMEKKIQPKVEMISEKPKTVKYKLPIQEIKPKKMTNKVNPKTVNETKNEDNNVPDTHSPTGLLQIVRPVRSREEYQKIHEIGKKKDNLTMQSRIIVESILIKMDNSRYPNFNLLQSPQDMKQKVKLIYSLFPHAPCCPLSTQGVVRKKKIVQKYQEQSDQQIGERISAEMVKIQDTIVKASLSDKDPIAKNSRNFKTVGNNKVSKKRKVTFPQEESEEIVIKRPAKRSRQGRE